MIRIILLTVAISLGLNVTILKAQIIIPNYGHGITIKAADESAVMKFGFRVQSLFTAIDPGYGEDITYSMLVRRARIKSDGYLFDKKFGYKVELGLSNRDLGNGKEIPQSGYAPRLLLDGFIKYRPNKSWEFWFGQTKLPGNRERVISSQNLQFVDRSMMNSDFNVDRDFGAWVFYKQQLGEVPIKLGVAISGGEGRNIVTENTGGLSYTGRMDIQPLGKFTNKGDYFSADLEREQKPKLAIGLSFNLNQGASRQNGQLGKFVTDSNGLFTADLSNIMVDLMFKYKGWNILSEYGKRSSNEDFTSTLPLSSFFDLGSGFNFQAGYLFKNNYEIAARYTNIMADAKYSALKNTEQYTLGFSKYIVGHKLKCQTDISYTQIKGRAGPTLMYRFQMEFGI
jgi:phosphate-selective porin OprO and OprP